jgi:hypothetical protein
MKTGPLAGYQVDSLKVTLWTDLFTLLLMHYLLS